MGGQPSSNGDNSEQTGEMCGTESQDKISCHIKKVMSIVEKTDEQQKHVQHLSQICAGMDPKPGLDTLKEAQGVLEQLQKYAVDLYGNIQYILIVNEIQPFKINDHQPLTSLTDKQVIEKLNEKLINLEKANNEANLSIKELQTKNEELTIKIQEHEPYKRSDEIQLFYSHRGNTIEVIETKLKALLKNKLQNIEFIKPNSLSDVDHSKILIVLRIITSRLGTDAENAIKDVPRPENTALLLFHIKEIHALTKQASKDVLTDRLFEELGGIFDMGFSNGNGIYQCEVNETALESVCAFIKKGTPRQRDPAGSAV